MNRTNKAEGQTKGIRWYLLSLSALLLLLLSSCGGETKRQTMPLFTNQMLPAAARLTFPKGSNIPQLVFHVDQRKQRIFNSDYLAYGTELDSAYLDLPISTELQVTIQNVKTGITKAWSVADTSKIDISGGKLLITISKGGEDKGASFVTYDFRIMSYGYNPNLLTWKQMPHSLPVASKDGHVFSFKGQTYWLAVNENSERQLYRLLSTSPLEVERVSEVTLPHDLAVKSLFVEPDKQVWGLTESGDLYFTEDLAHWSLVDLNGREMTLLVSYDSGTLMTIGREDKTSKTYYTYRIKSNGELTREEQLYAGFPVRDSYIYSYAVEGDMHANVLGGFTADGSVATKSYFTSDGLHWGEAANNTKEQSLPSSGGLYLDPKNGRDLYLVGGRYGANLEPVATIKVSNNRGISWRELSKEQAPGSEFAPRYGAAGVVTLVNGSPSFLILGGMVNGVPSDEIWHGSLDMSGGIINSFDE